VGGLLPVLGMAGPVETKADATQSLEDAGLMIPLEAERRLNSTSGVPEDHAVCEGSRPV
jgi:hypothetical protein